MQKDKQQLRSEVYINKGDVPNGVVPPKEINPNSLKRLQNNTNFEEKTIQDSWNEFEMARNGNQMITILIVYLIYKF